MSKIALVPQIATTPEIADLITKLNKALAARYENQHATTISVGNNIISLNSPTFGLIPPVVEEEQKVLIIAMYNRDPADGWVFARQATPESKLWSARDRSWINTMVECGDPNLIVGDVMYEAKEFLASDLKKNGITG